MIQQALTYISSFDTFFLYAVQSIGPKWQPVAYFISHGVGSYLVMFIAFLLALVFLGKWRVAAELFIITGISFVTLTLLKHYFAVPRPYFIDPSIISYDSETSFAFPSGHALMSLVILFWVSLRHPKSHTMLWGSVIMLVAIGLSRIYLGVHYPSQIIAGWFFGAILFYLFRMVDKRLWAPFQKKLR